MRRWLSFDRALQLAAVLVGAVAVTAALHVPLSHAHFQTGEFSHKDSACESTTNRADPVMDTFYGNVGQVNGTTVGNHIQHHTGWTDQSGGQQWYKTHTSPSVCAQNASTSQRASGCGSCDRIHIRFIKTYHSDATWGDTAIGTPHDEYYNTFCGHAVRAPYGFQNGRTSIYNNMVAAGGHPFAGSFNWGNTAQQKQCDGNWVGSLDGKVDYIFVQ
jgi:hypothetical protein